MVKFENLCGEPGSEELSKARQFSEGVEALTNEVWGDEAGEVTVILAFQGPGADGMFVESTLDDPYVTAAALNETSRELVRALGGAPALLEKMLNAALGGHGRAKVLDLNNLPDDIPEFVRDALRKQVDAESETARD